MTSAWEKLAAAMNEAAKDPTRKKRASEWAKEFRVAVADVHSIARGRNVTGALLRPSDSSPLIVAMRKAEANPAERRTVKEWGKAFDRSVSYVYAAVSSHNLHDAVLRQKQVRPSGKLATQVTNRGFRHILVGEPILRAAGLQDATAVSFIARNGRILLRIGKQHG
jgi:hypothetical protein